MRIDLLQLYFGWHLARITCLSYLIVALFKVKTVNLAELATAFPGHAEIESHYRRMQRFFAQVEMKPALIAQLVVSFLPYTTYTLSLDRTNWMLGGFSMNFLVLSVVHQGMAFPLFWLFLPKQGNSNTQERMHLLTQFLDVFGRIGSSFFWRIDNLLGNNGSPIYSNIASAFVFGLNGI